MERRCSSEALADSSAPGLGRSRPARSELHGSMAVRDNRQADVGGTVKTVGDRVESMAPDRGSEQKRDTL